MFNNAAVSFPDTAFIMPPRSPSPVVPLAGVPSLVVRPVVVTPVLVPLAVVPHVVVATATLPCSLTLRIDTPRAEDTHRCLQDALGSALRIDDIATDCRGGRSTLLLHTDPDHLDALMHTIMMSLPEAEFGPIGRVGRAEQTERCQRLEQFDRLKLADEQVH